MCGIFYIIFPSFYRLSTTDTSILSLVAKKQAEDPSYDPLADPTLSAADRSLVRRERRQSSKTETPRTTPETTAGGSAAAASTKVPPPTAPRTSKAPPPVAPKKSTSMPTSANEAGTDTESANEVVAQLKTELASERKRADTAETRVVSLESDLTAATQQMDDIKKKHAAKVAQAEALEAKLKMSDDEVKKAVAELAKLREQLDQAEVQRQAHGESESAMAAQIQALTSQLDALTTRAAAPREDDDDTLPPAPRSVEPASAPSSTLPPPPSTDELSLEVDTLRDEVAELTASLDDAESRAEEAAKRADEYETMAAKLRIDLTRMSHQLDADSALFEGKVENETHQAHQIERLQEEVEELRAELSGHHGVVIEHADMKAEIGALKARVEKHGAEMQHKTRLLAEQNERIGELTTHLREAHEYRAAKGDVDENVGYLHLLDYDPELEADPHPEPELLQLETHLDQLHSILDQEHEVCGGGKERRKKKHWERNGLSKTCKRFREWHLP